MRKNWSFSNVESANLESLNYIGMSSNFISLLLDKILAITYIFGMSLTYA